MFFSTIVVISANENSLFVIACLPSTVYSSTASANNFWNVEESTSTLVGGFIPASLKLLANVMTESVRMFYIYQQQHPTFYYE